VESDPVSHYFRCLKPQPDDPTRQCGHVVQKKKARDAHRCGEGLYSFLHISLPNIRPITLTRVIWLFAGRRSKHCTCDRCEMLKMQLVSSTRTKQSKPVSSSRKSGRYSDSDSEPSMPPPPLTHRQATAAPVTVRFKFFPLSSLCVGASAHLKFVCTLCSVRCAAACTLH
jgi:hypothetical protein